MFAQLLGIDAFVLLSSVSPMPLIRFEKYPFFSSFPLSWVFKNTTFLSSNFAFSPSTLHNNARILQFLRIESIQFWQLWWVVDAWDDPKWCNNILSCKRESSILLSLGLILQMVINKPNSVGLQKWGAKGSFQPWERERFTLKEIFRIRLDTAYFVKNWNWKHYNKIIFKCVNSIVRPIFNIFFSE